LVLFSADENPIAAPKQQSIDREMPVDSNGRIPLLRSGPDKFLGHPHINTPFAPNSKPILVFFHIL
jgi:hypothetical protein